MFVKFRNLELVKPCREQIFLKKFLTSDVDYRNACWLKKEITQKYGKNEAVSGPKECGPDPDPSGK